jgi:putative two-component system response regulator
MHDIGKISLPHGLVHKPGKLTEAEYSTMRTHTQRAHDFLKHSDRLIMKAADVIAMQHHEKWDGTGYPKGLKGNEIHIYGRIVALADVFDALTHKRSYKDAWPLDEAVDYIQKLKGIHFDPELVDIFSEHIDEIAEIIES